jgi:glutaredoxin 3
MSSIAFAFITKILLVILKSVSIRAFLLPTNSAVILQQQRDENNVRQHSFHREAKDHTKFIALKKTKGDGEIEDPADFFLSQLANTVNGGETPDFMKPPLLPQDTKSKMKQWAGKYDREAMQARLKNRIEEFPVFFLKFETCPYCIKIEKILESKTISSSNMKIVELDSLGQEKYAIRREVIEMVNQTTIPAIWIGGKFVGGLQEVKKLDDIGELDALLENAKALGCC